MMNDQKRKNKRETLLVRGADVWIIPHEHLSTEEQRKHHAKMEEKRRKEKAQDIKDKQAWKKKRGKMPFITDK